jgi:hypothetical protein
MSGQADLASGHLHGKAYLFAVFTFTSGHPCRQELSVARVCWAVQTGSEHELYVVCVRWVVRTCIEHKVSLASVRTLILAIWTLYREVDFLIL